MVRIYTYVHNVFPVSLEDIFSILRQAVSLSSPVSGSTFIVFANIVTDIPRSFLSERELNNKLLNIIIVSIYLLYTSQL